VIRNVLSRASFSHFVRASPRGASRLLYSAPGADADCEVTGCMWIRGVELIEIVELRIAPNRKGLIDRRRLPDLGDTKMIQFLKNDNLLFSFGMYFSI
jgi:hypothetical protein